MEVIGLSIFSGFLLLASLAAVVMGFQKVPQGFQYTVERFGKYTKTLESGPQWIMPVADQVTHRLDMREQVLDVPSQEVITLDNATVQVNGVAFFKVENASKAAYAVTNYREAVLSLVTANIRGTAGSMKLDELLSKRDEISSDILGDVDAATQAWGIKVFRVKIQNIDPPESLTAAMTKQLTAEREKRATIHTAEGEREAAIMRAEGERQAAIMRAEGSKQATVLQAEADGQAALIYAKNEYEATVLRAQGREREAEAESKATLMMSQAISRGNLHAINYFVAEKYVEALKQIGNAKNSKVIMLPLEASNFMGALQGIGEIAKGAFGHDPTPPTPPQT